jgi:hypothetical protein
LDSFQEQKESMCSRVGVPMKLSGSGRLLALFVLIIIELSCGDTYRPVAIPQPPTPPNPGALHYMLVLTGNGPVNAGSSLRLDVSGDTAVAQAQVGLGPVSVAVLPAGTRTYVANSMEDTLSSFLTATPTAVTTTVIPVDPVTLDHPVPIFVQTAENSSLYVVNNFFVAPPGIPIAGTVDVVTVATNVVSNVIPVGMNPVALLETTDMNHLYALNQGTATVAGSVTSIDPVSKTVKTTITNGFGVGSFPAWMVQRSDNQKVYVLNTGSGTVTSIDTLSDTVTCGVSGLPVCPSVGAGANYMFYDRLRNRVYVTNPVTNNLVILNVAVDPPAVMFTTPVAAGPVSVTALNDGSRIYVASVQKVPPCTSNPADLRSCIQSQVTVLNAIDGSLRSTIPMQAVVSISAASEDALQQNTTYTYSQASGPALQAGMTVVISGMSDAGNNGTFIVGSASGNNFTITNALGVTNSGQSGVGNGVVEVDTANATGCDVSGLGIPGGVLGGVRFRMFVAAGADGKRVYAGSCDAGTTTVIRTVTESTNPPDSVVLTIPAAPSAFPPPVPGQQPPPQNPFFIFASQ